MPAFAYLRKSSVKNLATDVAPETQEREIRALAARFGDADRLVLKADWDISGAGKYTKKRLDYLELVRAIEDGSCSAVYSYSLSRLGRSVHELSRLFDLCASKGVPLRLVADAVDTSTASGRLLANVLASVAQFESEVASERQHARNMTKRLRGESLRTRKLYGESEGEDAGAVMAAFREAGSYAGASRLLNERAIPTRDGGPWWAASVSVVVRRLDPSIKAPARGARTVGAFALARLLICPSCKRFLTGTGGSARKPWRSYHCAHAGEDVPHGRVSIAERKVLPWVREQLTGYRLPGAKPADMTRERADLDAKRARILGNFDDGLYTKAERDQRLQPVLDTLAALDAKERAVNPAALDWDGDAGKLNTDLRTLVHSIRLDADFRPVRLNVRWLHPDDPALLHRDATGEVVGMYAGGESA